MSNSTSIGSATTGGGGAGRVSFAEFNFMKKLDKASPMIMKNCAIGDHFTEIDFTSRKPGGTQLEYYKIKFLECYITSYQISASDGGGDPMESVSFAYAKINTTYTEQLATGGSGSPVPWGWDLTTNKPAVRRR